MKPILYLFLLGCTLLPLSAPAAEKPADNDLIALEIRNLSTSVDRLTDLLYTQTQKNDQEQVLHKLDIAVAYLNFRSRRIEMMEHDLLNNRNLKTRLEDIVKQLELRLKETEEIAKSNTGTQIDNDLQVDETKDQLKLLKQRLARIDSVIIDYENRVLELHDQLDNVESYVEKNLKL